MRVLLTSALLTIAFGQMLIPQGIFSGTNGTLYTLLGAQEKDRYHLEAVEGCDIECTQSCLSSFHQEQLANCINLCSCQILLQSEHKPELHAISTLSFDVNISGQEQTYELGGSGGHVSLNVTDNANGSHNIVFDEQNVTGNRFDLYVDEQEYGKRTRKYVEWSTPEGSYDGFMYQDVVSGNNTYTSVGGAVLPNQEYYVETEKTVSWQEGPEGASVKLDENLRDFTGEYEVGVEAGVNQPANGPNRVAFDFEAKYKPRYDPNLRAYNVTVNYPDGSSEVVPVDDQPGYGFFNITEGANSTNYVYQDQRTPGVDFNLTHTFNYNDSQTEDKFVWKTLNHTADGNAFRNVQFVPNGFNEQDGLRLPKQNYRLDVKKEVRFEQTPTSEEFNLKEKITDSGHWAKVEAEGKHEYNAEGQAVKFAFEAEFDEKKPKVVVDVPVTVALDTESLSELKEESQDWSLVQIIVLFSVFALAIAGVAALLSRRKGNDEYYERLLVYHQLL